MSAALAESPFRQAIAALAAGQRQAAIPLLEQARAVGDGGAHAGLNLGMALADQGRLDRALPLLEAAARALPDLAEPHARLGAIAAMRNSPAAAAEHFRAALRRDPAHVPALAALAALEAAAGQLETAEQLLRAARSNAPTEPELDFAAAQLALAQGRPAQAAEHAVAVLAARPGHGRAARLLASAWRESLGLAGALLAAAARAAATPFSPAWPLVAALLHAAEGALGPALPEARLAEALAPESPDVAAELGRLLARAGDTVGAEAALRTAIAGRPNDAELRNLLSTLLWKGHRIGEMLALLDQAIAEFGPQAAFQMNRALALNAAGRQPEALAAADDAVRLSAGGREALINRMAVLPYHPRLGRPELLLENGRAIAAACPPLPPLATPPARADDPARRLRLGLLSGGLGVHPVGWLTLAGIEALPAAEFEIVAYALKPRQDALASRFRARAAQWRQIGEADDAAIAAMIAADGIDILLDLGGYGEGGRPLVMQHRPAPVQVKWVGAQFATTGLDTVDWMLTDRWETPPGFEAFYSERLLRLPDGYVCYTPPPYAPAVGPLPAERRGHITFGCFNNLAKITAEVLAAWARILAALPTARLVLRTHALGDAATRQAAEARMRAAGMPLDRLELRPGCPHAELLADYGGIDIALDPFPYTGGLTVCEALWMGVPVLSLAGGSFAARHALSHLSNVGLPDWVAADVPGYVAQAVARAVDLPALAALRRGLRRQVAASPLADAPRFGRNLSRALRFAWRDACARAAA